jgi:uncharacterized cupredoxin-like copper-binding protein
MIRFAGAIAAAAVLWLTVSGAFAHGDSKGSAWGRPGKAKDVTRTVKIEATEYAFSEKVLTFKAGETVKLVVTNKGGLKHELTIGDADEQASHGKEMAKMSDMGHSEGEHEMPANSIHVAPGETRELIWNFDKPGKLLFACNYPGHSALGMEGEIAVE